MEVTLVLRNEISKYRLGKRVIKAECATNEHFIFERRTTTNSSVFVSWVALDVYICILGAGWKRRDGARAVHAVTSDLGYPGRSAHYERLGRLLRDITGTPSLHFSLKLAINYIFILLLGAIKGIFVNRKILVFQITCDVFSPAAHARPTHSQREISARQNQQQNTRGAGTCWGKWSARLFLKCLTLLALALRETDKEIYGNNKEVEVLINKKRIKTLKAQFFSCSLSETTVDFE